MAHSIKNKIKTVEQTNRRRIAREELVKSLTIKGCAEESISLISNLPIDSECKHLNVNEISEDGFTPLRIACIRGELSVVMVLVEFGADIMLSDISAEPSENNNAHRSDGFTPLHIAAYYGHASIVKYLLHCGADRTARTNGDARSLVQCMEMLRNTRIQEENDDNPDANTRNPNDRYFDSNIFYGNYTPVELAVLKCHTEVAGVLACYRVAAARSLTSCDMRNGERKLNGAGNPEYQQKFLRVWDADEKKGYIAKIETPEERQARKRAREERLAKRPRRPIVKRRAWLEYDHFDGENRYGFSYSDDDLDGKMGAINISDFDDDSDAFYTDDEDDCSESDGEYRRYPHVRQNRQNKLKDLRRKINTSHYSESRDMVWERPKKEYISESKKNRI